MSIDGAQKNDWCGDLPNGMRRRVIEHVKGIVDAGSVKPARMRVLLTGHSLGGAVAQLCAHDLANQCGLKSCQARINLIAHLLRASQLSQGGWKELAETDQTRVKSAPRCQVAASALGGLRRSQVQDVVNKLLRKMSFFFGTARDLREACALALVKGLLVRSPVAGVHLWRAAAWQQGIPDGVR